MADLVTPGTPDLDFLTKSGDILTETDDLIPRAIFDAMITAIADIMPPDAVIGWNTVDGRRVVYYFGNASNARKALAIIEPIASAYRDEHIRNNATLANPPNEGIDSDPGDISAADPWTNEVPRDGDRL